MQILTENWLEDLVSLVYPDLCVCCGNKLFKGEEVICIICQHLLPKTSFHLEKDNPVHKIFWGKVNVEFAASCYYFQKEGSVQRLLHQFKYKGRKEVGLKVGDLYGADLMESPYFQDIDMIIPVPLHPRKERQRRYNQSNLFAEGLSQKMQIPWRKDVLFRIKDNPTQTGKKYYERRENVESIFEMRNKHLIEDKHVLLVDDVVTSGSTLEECAKTLQEAENVKVSIATIACVVKI